MTEASDRMLVLLQELEILKEEEQTGNATPVAARKRRKEIKTEIKQLAAEKRAAEAS